MKTVIYSNPYKGKYADDESTILCILEDNETVQDVIDKCEIKDEYMMWETRLEIVEQTNKYNLNGTEYTGNLVVVKAISPYLD